MWPTRNVKGNAWNWNHYSNRQAIDEGLSWLLKDSLDLVLLYFPDPDMMLHNYGHDDPRTLKKIRETDADNRLSI